MPVNRKYKKEDVTPTMFFGTSGSTDLRIATTANFSQATCLAARTFKVYAKTITLGNQGEMAPQKIYSPDFKLTADTITVNHNVEIVDGSNGFLNCKKIIFMMNANGELSSGQEVLRGWLNPGFVQVNQMYT